MKKVLRQGDSFTNWNIKQVAITLRNKYNIDLGITGNNGKNYFKHKLENKYNVYFMKHWSTFGEIYDATNQQITNIVDDPTKRTINEHWRGFSHQEVFKRYKNKGVKQAEYEHNFNTNDGDRLVFAREGETSWVFWGVYSLKEIDQKSKTKIWVRKSLTYPIGK